jgi:hypothetical protein
MTKSSLKNKELLNKAMNDRLDLKMRYCDFYGRVTIRIITPICWVTEDKFLAFCHLRQAERHFRAENILELQPITVESVQPDKSMGMLRDEVAPENEVISKSLSVMSESNPSDDDYETRALEERLKLLENELAEQELELTTLKGNLIAFDHFYMESAGKYFAELDELEAQIAEIDAALNPDSQELQNQAQKARQQSHRSHEEVDDAEKIPEAKIRFNPDENIKELYREIAKKIHPDLSTTEAEKSIRNNLMVEVNSAYEKGDKEALEALLEECENPPQNQDGITHIRIANLKRKIKQVEKRLIDIQVEFINLRSTHLYRLRTEVLENKNAGVDLLGRMATEINEKIALRKILLEKLLKIFMTTSQKQ